MLFGGFGFRGGSREVLGGLNFRELALAKGFYESQLLDGEAVLEVDQTVDVLLEYQADIFACGGLAPLVTSLVEWSDLIFSGSVDSEWEFHCVSFEIRIHP